MDFLEELTSAEKLLLQAETEFLDGKDGIVYSLLDIFSTGIFSNEAKTAQKLVDNLDESRYIKWSRWDRKFEFLGSFWKDEGYPSIDADPDWYSKRTDTTSFVKDLMRNRTVIAPTDNGERDGSPTPLGNPANRWLLDFVGLSSLRLSFKQHWEQMVKDIVSKRSVTNLMLVSERLGLTPQEILIIARKIRDFDDHVIEHHVSDPSKNMTYVRRKPNPDLVPRVDISE